MENELKMPFEIVEKTPSNMDYLILYIGEMDGEEVKSFEIIEGREKAYEFIKSILEFIDIEESKVISEIMTLEEAGSVKDFMISMREYFPNDTFDTSEYFEG